MIDRVYRGWQPGGLIRYLFGPGRFNEHENPRVVATWDGRPDQWQRAATGPGKFDFDLRPLISALSAPMSAAGLPLVTPDPDNPEHARFFRTLPDGRRVAQQGPVFHVTLRNADDDRVLTDAEWGHIAEEMMHRSGVARRGDVGAPRWVAVRHDDDGIHIMATLVRQDTARRVHPQYYKRRLRAAAEAMEALYGVTSTAPADRTAAVAESRAEKEKAARAGRDVAARVEVRDAVAQAAAVSVDLDGFQQALESRGYGVELVRFPSGDLRGYKVARPEDVDRQGEPIWFSGSKLAADLSLPRLLRRWEQTRRGGMSPRARSNVAPVGADAGQWWVRYTLTAVDAARVGLQRDPSQVDGVAHAVGDVFAALDHGEGHVVSGHGARWDRAARAPYTPVPVTAVLAEDLRWAAWGLGSTGVGSSAALELLAALAALALQIAALHQHNGRVHQARAARRAARLDSGPVSPRPRAQPTQPIAARGPTQKRGRGSGETTARQGVRGQSWTQRTGPPSGPRRPTQGQ